MADEKPTKPVEPGPTCTEAERHGYAQNNAKWSAWIDQHPEDAEQVEMPPPNPREAA